MMNPRSPTSASAHSGYPHKRARHSPPETSPRSIEEIPEPLSALEPAAAAPLNRSNTGSNLDTEGGGGGNGGGVTVATGAGAGGSGKSGQSSSFRNVSACNRCRLRKNRCDQKLPSCASCAKASVKCVGYDPITKREIPRSYVFYLEQRIGYLEDLLSNNSIAFAPADVLDHTARSGIDPSTVQTPSDDGRPQFVGPDTSIISQKSTPQEVARTQKQNESDRVNKLVSNIGMISVQGASDHRYLGSTSGISFARVVFAAVKSSVSGASSDKSGVRPSKHPATIKPGAAPGGTSMRDSFFGLHTKPTIKQAPFPDKDVGRRLVDFYFEHANPQIPILHRGEFMRMFEAAYADGENRVRTPRELYMLNIVFAIGSGIFLGDSGGDKDGLKSGENSDRNKRTAAGRQCQPEEYHASAIVHLESCLSSPSSVERDGFGGGLEELQAVLLLAGFALLRPVAPGLWYIIGVAVRLAVDLGLHYEDGKDIDFGLQDLADDLNGDDSDAARLKKERNAREKGHREYVRDFRRRLWWCTYSFDRLVSTCVGRPFGITDQVVTTEFPSLLEDKYITPDGFLEPPRGTIEPSYKHAAYHYFRLRLLQSEILQVLQHQQAQQARAGGANQQNPFMHTHLRSPFLSKFESFRSWRIDIDKRLYQWKSSAPSKAQTGVAFSLEFLELNYWQCVIMLYRQSLSVPPMFEGEFNTSEEVESPSTHTIELREDEERVFLKVAEAGQKVLRLYRQLHRVHLVNYTFLATHHLFMAGISFLYAIWHSAIVRSRLTMDEVDFTILAATSVLGDLIEKCPPAEACRDAFDRMSKATVQMCMSTTGFSSSTQGLSSRRSHGTGEHHENDYFNSNNSQYAPRRQKQQSQAPSRPKPKFDMALNELLGPHQSAPIQTPQPPTQYRNNSQSNNSGVKVEYDQFRQTQAPSQTTQQQALSSPTPSNYAISPNVENSAIDPSLLPHQNQTSPAQSYTTQASGPLPTSNPHPFESVEYPFAGMDFLQGNANYDTGTNGNGNGFGGGGAFDPALPPGADLGAFGMGWDGGLEGLDVQHDFSEGQPGLDLFDGFFFGGTGTY
ncbi:fungal specific transcription factor [Phlyctema vagabunda]|uniref:Fungal specific transcription factor n=1 Tax=Phlyctema vagabunda TaxID=108571 RepID=A0ABR4PCY0_9HELO